MRLLAGAACLLFVLTFAAECRATAFALARASSTTAATAFGGMVVTISPDFPAEETSFPTPTTMGDFSFTQAGFNAPGIGILDALASATADAPPTSSAAVTTMTGDRIRLDNSSGSARATAEFILSYEAMATVSTTDPFETAVATPFIHITGIEPTGPELLEVDTTGTGLMFAVVPEFLVDLTQDTSAGDTGASETETILFKVTIPAFSIHEFSVITDAHAFAGAEEVPEPHTVLALCSLGMVGLVAVRRRKRS